MSSHHPADDNLGEYLIDPGTAANIVSQLLSIVIAFLGPDKAKAALDWQVAQAANAAADASKVATDVAAYEILKSRGVL